MHESHFAPMVRSLAAPSERYWKAVTISGMSDWLADELRFEVAFCDQISRVGDQTPTRDAGRPALLVPDLLS